MATPVSLDWQMFDELEPTAEEVRKSIPGRGNGMCKVLGTRETTTSLSNCQQLGMAETVLREMGYMRPERGTWEKAQDHGHQAERFQSCWGTWGGPQAGVGQASPRERIPWGPVEDGLEGKMGGREARQEFQRKK